MMEIQLDAPGKNALSTPMMTQLLEQLQAARGEPILLTGAGDVFSAGLNLREIVSLDVSGMSAFLTLLERVCVALYRHDAPVVAHVNGHAIAGGCVLAQCCDFRIAGTADRFRMGLNEVALGLRFPPAVLRICRAQIPPRAHSEVFLGAKLVSPRDALRLGMLDELADSPRERAEALLAMLSEYPREAYAMTKRDLRPDPSASAEEHAHFEREVVPLWTSDTVRAQILSALKR